MFKTSDFPFIFPDRGNVLIMEIDQFISMCSYGFYQEKYDKCLEILDRGESFHNTPKLYFKRHGTTIKVHGHEGRHRSRALKARGHEFVPVLLVGDLRVWPTKMIGESRKEMDFPDANSPRRIRLAKSANKKRNRSSSSP